MAKNPGRGRNVSRRNSVPNVIGQTTASAQSNLTAAGFDAFVTGTQNTADQNLDDKIVSQSIPAGEVRELGADVNLVKYTFSFTPFSAFGFTPFGAFGFTPFGAFGFTPFGAFTFSPPTCIEGNTLINTPNGKIAAKDLNIGDVISSLSLEEISDLGDEEFDYVGFISPTLTSNGITETTIIDIEASKRNVVMCFNNEKEKLYSISQPVFIKNSSNKYEIVPTGSVDVGNMLIKVMPDGSINETEITDIELIPGDFTVYEFSCEPADWFIAGDYLVHNK